MRRPKSALHYTCSYSPEQYEGWKSLHSPSRRTLLPSSNETLKQLLIRRGLQEERKQLADSLSESRDNVTDLKARIDDLEMFLNPFQAEKRAAIEDRNAQKQQR